MHAELVVVGLDKAIQVYLLEGIWGQPNLSAVAPANHVPGQVSMETAGHAAQRPGCAPWWDLEDGWCPGPRRGWFAVHGVRLLG
jgi:hypothetical protein